MHNMTFLKTMWHVEIHYDRLQTSSYNSTTAMNLKQITAKHLPVIKLSMKRHNALPNIS